MNTRILSIIGLVILGGALFFGGLFWGRSQTNALGFYPGSMMNEQTAVPNGYANIPQGNYNYDTTNGRYGMMDNSFGGNAGMMGGGNQMNGGSMMNGGAGMMGGVMGNASGLVNVDPLTLEEATTAVSDYLDALNNNNLELGEVMVFDNHAYAQVMDIATGAGAFEVLVDPVTGNVLPEPGPNMMWNSEYSPMAGMMGAGMMSGSAGMMGDSGFATNDTDGPGSVTAEDAVSIAQEYLDASLPSTTASDDVTAFPGYTTLHIEEDGVIIGMLGVNAASGEVFPHFWHGDFITMSEHAK